MSTVFEKKKHKVAVRQYSGHQLPPELAAIRSLMMKEKPKEESSTRTPPEPLVRVKTELPLKEPMKIKKEVEPVEVVVDSDGIPNLRAQPRVQYTRLQHSGRPEDWEDIGSQTDYSEVSDGEYSDETSDQKRLREQVAEQKQMKRQRRIKMINKKHGIL